MHVKLDVTYPAWYGKVLRSIKKPLFAIPGIRWHAWEDEGVAGDSPALMLPPRVALLFLTPGPMPLSSLWRQWFDTAAGQIPKTYIDGLYANLPYADARASILHTQQWVTTAMADSQATPIDRQFLFSVYMHTHPNYTEPTPSLFAPHVRCNSHGCTVVSSNTTGH